MLEVVLPLKEISLAKSRLSAVLDADQRMALVIAMARDLVDLTTAHPAVARVIVIAGQGWEDQLERRPGLELLREADLDGRGLNPLLASAVEALRPARALVLHGDLPLLRRADLDALQRLLARQELVLCPDDARRGTNALAFRHRARPAFRFGAGSFDIHRRDAMQRRYSWRMLATPGFGLDVDSPSDLRSLVRRVSAGGWVGEHTGDWLRRHWPALAPWRGEEGAPVAAAVCPIRGALVP